MDEEKQCKACGEFWPSDVEFYRSEKSVFCIACEKEKRRPLNSILTLKPHEFEHQMKVCRAARLAAQLKV